jgi:hypothetical protein
MKKSWSARGEFAAGVLNAQYPKIISRQYAVVFRARHATSLGSGSADTAGSHSVAE